MMQNPPVRVVIAGGGTAGWISACALARQLGSLVEVTLVESDAIPTIGVGEATIPTARAFHEYLRIDERAFMQTTGATFKLAIRFDDWGQIGESYVHSFGTFGLKTWVADFQHFWLEARAAGETAPIGAWCLEHEAALAGKFAAGGQPPLNYAYHLDAGRYAAFLRSIAEGDGARRVEGTIASVERNSENGDIAALVLTSGERIAGDLFIDCTGFRGLLIEQELESGYDDWSEYLPTDGAWAVQTENTGDPLPYTRAVAHEAGWRWQIPLQHRTGNGLVFASTFMNAEEARQKFVDSLAAEGAGAMVGEPRLIRFVTGKRRQMWKGNCIALGLSSGFVEPLESTSIHLIMIGITRLLQMFPFDGATLALRARWNSLADRELEHVRDFIVLHYHLTQRDDSEFWRSRREMRIPHTLRARIDSFRENAQAWQEGQDMFRVDSWLQVMLGQGLDPQSWHRLPHLMSDGRLRRTMQDQREAISARVEAMSSHAEFLRTYCAK
ncbi:tryptophan halogenase family protein [Altererythrobacter sp. CAU 1778]